MLGNVDLAQCVCNELLVDSDGDDSIVDSEFGDKETDSEASMEMTDMLMVFKGAVMTAMQMVRKMAMKQDTCVTKKLTPIFGKLCRK